MKSNLVSSQPAPVVLNKTCFNFKIPLCCPAHCPEPTTALVWWPVLLLPSCVFSVLVVAVVGCGAIRLARNITPQSDVELVVSQEL